MASPPANQPSAAQSSKRLRQHLTWCRPPLAVCKTAKSGKLRPVSSAPPVALNCGRRETETATRTLVQTIPSGQTKRLLRSARLKLTSSITSTPTEVKLQQPLKSLDRRSAGQV